VTIVRRTVRVSKEAPVALGADAPLLRSVVGDKRSAVDLVTVEVRRAILAGSLRPGQQFAVTDLCAQLGVSHVPVREALRRLEVQGLVVLNQARRPMVAPLDVEDLDAIYALRLQLEPPMFARAVAVADEAWIAELGRLVVASFDEHAHADSQWDHHHLLHAALVSPTATAWEMRLLQQLWDAATRYTRLVFDPETASGPAERAKRHAAHEELLVPARTRDVDGAAALLQQHLERNLVTIRRLMSDTLAGSG
jgi:DNA-binding GntR family transcriptional regulator